MKKRLVIIFLFSACVSFGQSNYLVYQLKGKVWESVSKERKPLRIGQVVKNDALLWLDKGSGLTLICENYSTFSVNTTGWYVVGKNHEICSRENSSITADYFKFIWEELTHPHESPEDNRRKYMHNKGAVIRGCPGVLIDHIFDTINHCHNGMSISWQTNLSNDRLSFVLYADENNDDPIFSTPLKKDFISLDTIKNYAGGRDSVYWGINVDGNKVCPGKYIRFWPENKYDLYLDSLKKSLPAIMDKAEWNYMLGFLLETDSFIAEAYDFYQHAAGIDPTSERYRLTAAGLKKKLGTK